MPGTNLQELAIYILVKLYYLYLYLHYNSWIPLFTTFNTPFLRGGSAVKNPPAAAGDARDVSSIPGSGRSPGVGNDNPL